MNGLRPSGNGYATGGSGFGVDVDLVVFEGAVLALPAGALVAGGFTEASAADDRMQPTAPTATMRPDFRFNPTQPPLSGAADRTAHRWSYTELHMGVPVRCTLFSNTDASARSAARTVFGTFGRCDAVFSDWRPETEAMRLCAEADGRWHPVSPMMHTVLRDALRVARATGGVFDVTVGPLVRLWRESRRSGSLPSPAALRDARRRVGIDRIEIDPVRPKARVTPGTLLDFGGIAKGYAARLAVDSAMKLPGVGSVLVEAGGDIAAGPPPPGASGWRIALPSGSIVNLERSSLSTSGDDYQRVEIAGRRYAHIVDPRTGLGAESVRRTCVQGRDGGLVDALATAACLLDDAARTH
ncbi:MAG: FAD:protein FMN transferase, partial [Armatimonadota bacterium]